MKEREEKWRKVGLRLRTREHRGPRGYADEGTPNKTRGRADEYARKHHHCMRIDGKARRADAPTDAPEHAVIT